MEGATSGPLQTPGGATGLSPSAIGYGERGSQDLYGCMCCDVLGCVVLCCDRLGCVMLCCVVFACVVLCNKAGLG